jgi:hypothetical protein
MSNDDTTSELEKLRAELAVLKEAQREPVAPSPAQGTPGQETSAEASTEASSGQGESSTVAEAVDAETGEEDVKGQLEELATLLEHEIRDLPTITCLAVFSLGILMGRLLR